MKITFDDFITCLQGCGWKGTGDAQHEAIKVFYECLMEQGNKPPTDWPEYAARLAPLLPEWVNFMAYDSMVGYYEYRPHENAPSEEWILGNGEHGLIADMDFPGQNWRESLLRVVRNPDGSVTCEAGT